MGYATKLVKVTAKCTCKKCGTSFERTTEKYGRAAANSWKYWAQNNITECPACYRNSEEERRQQELAQEARRLCLPELQAASVKQKAYAERIRFDVLRRNDYLVDDVGEMVRFPNCYRSQCLMKDTGTTTVREAIYASGNSAMIAVYNMFTETTAKLIIDLYK